MAKARLQDDAVKIYVKGSVRRMVVGSVICFGIMGFAFILSFPACGRYDSVTEVRQIGNKYYLTFKGDTGVFGMWSEKKAKVGDNICIRPTFAQ